MAILLTPETQKLIEERMKQIGVATADEFIRAAIDALDHVAGGEETDDLDPETWAAIDRAEAQYERGEGIPLDEAFSRLRQKFSGE